MSAPAKPLLRPSLSEQRPSLTAITRAVDEHAAERGIPTVIPTPSPAQAEQPPAPATPLKVVTGKKEKAVQAADQGPSPTKRLSVDIPDYLRTALKKKAADGENTIKYLICRALKKDGFQVEARDLVEDGRREH